MIYNSLEVLRKMESKQESCLPPEIIDTIRTLPENILEKLQLSTTSDLLFIVLPIEDDMRHLSVVYRDSPSVFSQDDFYIDWRKT